jgi:hypothetical protein
MGPSRHDEVHPMKCEHCGGENVGPDLVCNTCGTRAAGVRRMPSVGAAKGLSALSRSPSGVKTEFHARSGLPLETDVLPMPPVPTASAATPLTPLAPSSSPRPVLPLRPLRPLRPPPDIDPAQGTPGQQAFERNASRPPGLAEQLFPDLDAFPQSWPNPQNPQVEYAARESSNLHRAIIGLMVTGAVAFGFTMDWWPGSGKPLDTSAMGSPARLNPAAASAAATPLQRSVAVPDQASDGHSLRETEKPGTVALALPMLEPHEPPPRQGADGTSSSSSSDAASVQPSSSPTQATATTAATAGLDRTPPAVQSLDVRRTDQKVASNSKTSSSKKGKRHKRHASQVNQTAAAAAGNPKAKRLDEIDRLQLQAFSETTRDRIGRVTPSARSSGELLQQSARANTEHAPRSVTRSAYGQCERLSGFIDREQCKWRVCNGKWGQNDCPSFNHANVY